MILFINSSKIKNGDENQIYNFFIFLQLSGVSQDISYYKEFHDAKSKCIFDCGVSKNIGRAVGECMTKVKFPSFYVLDWNNKPISSSVKNTLTIISYMELDNPRSEENKIYIDKLKEKYVKLRLVAVFSENKKDIHKGYNLHSFNNWNVITEADGKRFPRTQYGKPLIILINSNGAILQYIWGPLKKFDLNLFENIIKQQWLK